MAKIEVKKVQPNATIVDVEPHWEAVVDYGGFDVKIPLPARYLIDDDVETQTREFIEAMESLAVALLLFAGQTRKQWLHDQG